MCSVIACSTVDSGFQSRSRKSKDCTIRIFSFEFSPCFSGVRVPRYLVLSSPPVLVGFVFFDIQFFVQCFVDHCLSIVLSVLFRYTASDYPCVICKRFVKPILVTDFCFIVNLFFYFIEIHKQILSVYFRGLMRF